ncbi:hypothetical protein K438DRAFT_1774479 [Mycena galopus ATCC 62051]|nr:hypothetical protein K438DRAFT_1774479 [Mycena galopus ATCC 62051]
MFLECTPCTALTSLVVRCLLCLSKCALTVQLDPRMKNAENRGVLTVLVSGTHRSWSGSYMNDTDEGTREAIVELVFLVARGTDSRPECGSASHIGAKRYRFIDIVLAKNWSQRCIRTNGSSSCSLRAAARAVTGTALKSTVFPRHVTRPLDKFQTF